MNPTSLTEYLERRKPKVVELRRTPAWIRRQQENRLPVQDRTAYIRGAAVPGGSDGAA